jgi:hypothetical protein
MITVLLHLLRLLPFFIGGHRQLALENLALRHQLAIYKRTVTRPRDPALRPADRRSPARQRRDQHPGRAHGRREPSLGRPENPR